MECVLLHLRNSPGKGLSAEQNDVFRKNSFPVAVSLCGNQILHYTDGIHSHWVE